MKTEAGPFSHQALHEALKNVFFFWGGGVGGRGLKHSSFRAFIGFSFRIFIKLSKNQYKFIDL